MTRSGMRLLAGMALTVILAACGQQSGEKYSKSLLIDSYDRPLGSRQVDFGSSSGTRIEVAGYLGAKKCGAKSLRIKYNLLQGGYMYCARGYRLDAPGALWDGPHPEKIDWNAYSGFSVQVYGSRRGPIAFDVKDNDGELHRFLIDDNFSGWREIYIPFSSLVSRTDWQPQNITVNKVIDFPIWSYQYEPKNPGEGQVYFDCLQLVKE
ncbi:MAG: hypothetical protein KC897_09045 [Candidatus Omnitrophica bacterium]|nr:hypothetical protein [Candidatus Omnitrophota bacterium]MCB9719278.1 hypothetical protein [Candidatus Omnitrophota bacterium]